jgi:hypothetical protein
MPVLCCFGPMPWSSKEQPSLFDTTPIDGLQFLLGAVLAERYQQERLNDQKYPVIHFPSGVTRELRPGGTDQQTPFVHMMGALALPYQTTRDAAYELAQTAAQARDFQVLKQFDNNLTIMNAEGNRAYHVIFDNQHRQLIDLIHYPRWAMEILDGVSRAALPPLYSMEKQGLNAVAPIKFFTPDSGWTWYPTEFDGEDLFFGLVAGLEVELGYFSWAELEAVRGPLGQPIERDLYFKPTPLKTLKQYHERS